MAKTVAMGVQDFAKLIENKCFYVDKTGFIMEWWDSEDDVTLITRPRRFGKTLNMSMLNYFFSNKYAVRGNLFEGLNIFKEDRFRELQGSFPVIFITFAGVKADNYDGALFGIKRQLTRIFSEFDFLGKTDSITEKDKKSFDRVDDEMSAS